MWNLARQQPTWLCSLGVQTRLGDKQPTLCGRPGRALWLQKDGRGICGVSAPTEVMLLRGGGAMVSAGSGPIDS